MTCLVKIGEKERVRWRVRPECLPAVHGWEVVPTGVEMREEVTN